ncbi:PREDICTED: nuclear transcription factor Y subunit A-10-like isoform X2 [Ipomoea nil]|uniref:nuclear transcription factor Y subunit A-10-like isoform X2 n=1 Tax=Ipomoea nil TaxID=35883 RepID=UPI000900E3D9|nr:PREDICTED: nuclear transcription factor Y subunit A-10-like isoform X2 [Ipomoea nil]
MGFVSLTAQQFRDYNCYSSSFSYTILYYIGAGSRKSLVQKAGKLFMTMQSVFSKEHEGIAQNPMVPWWSVAQPTAYDETLGQLKDASGNHKQSEGEGALELEQSLSKGIPPQFTVFSGNVTKFPQVEATISVQPTSTEYRGSFELGFGQSVVYAKNPYSEQCYGVYSAYGPQVAGRIMLPLNLSSDEGPIFVNAKQYHGIMRRRKCRAKAEMENKVKPRKPYLHLSRHLHATRRPRGCGGRFLNTKDVKGATGSKRKRSEVGSMFDREDPEDHHRPHPINAHLHSSLRASPDMMMNTGHDFLMAGKWMAAAADSCCNLKV